MDTATAERLLAVHAAARDGLLAGFVEWARVGGFGLWRVGSGSRGTGDGWSDLDLVVRVPCRRIRGRRCGW
ncbi:hypothetical protein R8Z50_17700 [Longispora sp. K20-0274]|uniref:hypothetical protein n=1 Tax=Longispora sp. K20-0274 TaxID=3088255 RepID=UPI00399A30BD